MIFLKQFLFHCCKRILIWQKILEVFCRIYLNIIFLNIIVNVNFFGDLKLKYYCEYYPEILLQERVK